MTKKYARIIPLIMLTSVLLAIAFASCGAPLSDAVVLIERFASQDEEYDSISMEDIYIPQGVRSDGLGLFWADGNGWKKSDDENAAFDAEKPVIIFAHGMGSGSYGPYRDKWLSAGYNVGCFVWSNFSDDEPFTGQSKVWGINGNKMRWKRADGGYEYADIPSHSLAEIYAACYFDFMSSIDYKGSEIRFFGHSLGAQLTVALSSYFLAALENSKMNPKYMPERVTLLDPYLSNASDQTYVTWLDATLAEGGSVKTALDTVNKLKAIGVAVELVRSSPWVEMAAAAFNKGDDGYNAALRQAVMHVDIDTKFLTTKYGIYNGIAARHEVGEDWYSGAVSEGLWPDSAVDGSLEYGVSPLTPTSYVYARMGNAYALGLNGTENDYKDDAQRSLNIQKAKIAGFAFLDQNGNGLMDDGIASRMSGITVSLYEKGKRKAISTQITGVSGYYCFEVEPNSNNYHIKVSGVKGYSFVDKFGIDIYRANGVDAKGQSGDFTLAYANSLRIINIGLKAK